MRVRQHHRGTFPDYEVRGPCGTLVQQRQGAEHTVVIEGETSHAMLCFVK